MTPEQILSTKYNELCAYKTLYPGKTFEEAKDLIEFRMLSLKNSGISPELQAIIDKITLQPIGDRILVYQDTPEKVLASGIIIPDTASEKPQSGYVVAVGTGKPIDNVIFKYIVRICKFLGVHVEDEIAPIIFKVGDHVLYGRYSGAELTHNDLKLLIVRESDIAARIDD